ncbi:MAG: hypothetical protein ABID38_06935 [Candidatus Diapherotrites archaeon]
MRKVLFALPILGILSSGCMDGCGWKDSYITDLRVEPSIPCLSVSVNNCNGGVLEIINDCDENFEIGDALIYSNYNDAIEIVRNPKGQTLVMESNGNYTSYVPDEDIFLSANGNIGEKIISISYVKKNNGEEPMFPIQFKIQEEIEKINYCSKDFDCALQETYILSHIENNGEVPDCHVFANKNEELSEIRDMISHNFPLSDLNISRSICFPSKSKIGPMCINGKCVPKPTILLKQFNVPCETDSECDTGFDCKEVLQDVMTKRCVESDMDYYKGHCKEIDQNPPELTYELDACGKDPCGSVCDDENNCYPVKTKVGCENISDNPGGMLGMPRCIWISRRDGCQPNNGYQ